MFKFSLFVILFFRIFLFFLPGLHIDIVNWEGWAQRLNLVGFSNFYSTGFSDYFPGYLYMLWVMGKLFINLPFEILVKSVTTIFDIGTSYYVYKIVLKYKPAFAKMSAIFYFANPALIFNSSVWGQIDGIMTFFLVYAFYSLTELKKSIRWSFFSSLGILVKPQSLALLPVMLIKNFQMFKLKELVKSLILLPLFLILFSIPFFQNNILGLLNLSLSSINIYPFTSLFAFNFWAIFDWWKPDGTQWLVFSFKTWGILLYGLAMIVILIPLLRTKIKSSQYFYIASALSLMAFYLFPTRIHERYLFPFFAFILISALIQKTKETKILIGVYLVTSAVHLINLWYVYYFYNFVYNNPNLSLSKLYLFINDYYKFFSLTLLASFAVVLFVYYRIIYVKKNKA